MTTTEDRMASPRLTLDLVPSTAWWNNVRDKVTSAQWAKCKAYAKAKTDSRCIICGGIGQEQGRRHAVEAHEIWEYVREGDKLIQRLVDIIPLCPKCHQCKHMGRSINTMPMEKYFELFTHFVKVNGWEDDPTIAEHYINTQFALWELRSNMKWDLDISFLDQIGVQVREKFRG